MSILYNVACVKDLGLSYRVHHVSKSDMAFIEPGKLYIKISSLCSNIIREELEKGTEVIIPKDLEREVLPSDLILNPTDELSVAKGVALARMSSKVNSHLMSVSALDFYEFFTIHTKLLDDGYIITGNRQQKYLDIINSKEEKVIENLKTYLKLRDRIDVVSWAYKQYKSAEEALSSASEIEQVKQIEMSFYEAVENPQ